MERHLAMLVSLALACSSGPRGGEEERSADPTARRQTEAGEVVGFVGERGNHAWLGIPFAKPPAGHLRWRTPQPPEPSSKPREALHPGPACPQFPITLAGERAEGDGIVGDEDCLYLNVFAPRFSPEQVGARLPVMFWIHGGGNTIGQAPRTMAGPLPWSRTCSW